VCFLADRWLRSVVVRDEAPKHTADGESHPSELFPICTR